MNKCKKLKRGFIREDGKIFWCYNPSCKNGEWWLEPEKFYQRINKIRLSSKPYKQRIKNKEVSFESKREKLNSYGKQYAKNNRARINEYYRKKRKEDFFYKSNIGIRKSISRSFKKLGYAKNSKTEKILGCSFENFKKHIENQFQPGMSWENRSEWHLDHIMPVTMAKTHDELLRLNHYRNFRPMWASENIRKSNKTPETLVLF